MQPTVTKAVFQMTPQERSEELDRLKAEPRDFTYEHANAHNVYHQANRRMRARRILVLELWLEPKSGTCSVCQLLGRGVVPLLPQESQGQLTGFLCCAHPACALVYQAPGGRGE